VEGKRGKEKNNVGEEKDRYLSDSTSGEERAKENHSFSIRKEGRENFTRGFFFGMGTSCAGKKKKKGTTSGSHGRIGGETEADAIRSDFPHRGGGEGGGSVSPQVSAARPKASSTKKRRGEREKKHRHSCNCSGGKGRGKFHHVMNLGFFSSSSDSEDQKKGKGEFLWDRTLKRERRGEGGGSKPSYHSGLFCLNSGVRRGEGEEWPFGAAGKEREGGKAMRGGQSGREHCESLSSGEEKKQFP